MAYNQQITIYIERSNNYSIYFSYNQNTIFQDLFEFIIYNNPEKNICPCYKMQYYNNSNGTYYDLSLNENVYNYINNNSYKQYNLEKKANPQRALTKRKSLRIYSLILRSLTGKYMSAKTELPGLRFSFPYETFNTKIIKIFLNCRNFIYIIY